MPITKHNYIVKDVNNLAATIRNAFFIAREGRPGPVLIDVPKDVTAAMGSILPSSALAQTDRKHLKNGASGQLITLLRESKSRCFTLAAG